MSKGKTQDAELTHCALFGVLFYLQQGDEEMRPDLKEQLKEWKRQHREVTGYGKKKKRRHKTQKGKSKHLSERDIKTLMGYYEPVYKRGRGGAWRNGR